MKISDRAFIAILALAAAAWIVYEMVRPMRGGSGQNEPVPVIDEQAVSVTEQKPDTEFVAAPPLMAMLPTQAE